MQAHDCGFQHIGSESLSFSHRTDKNQEILWKLVLLDEKQLTEKEFSLSTTGKKENTVTHFSCYPIISSELFPQELLWLYIYTYIHTYIYVASWLGRSPEKGNGIPLQDSCMWNPMDRGAWWVACSPQCHKEFDTSQQLKKNSNIHTYRYIERQTERQRETETETKTDSDRFMVAYELLLLLLSHFSCVQLCATP